MCSHKLSRSLKKAAAHPLISILVVKLIQNTMSLIKSSGLLQIPEYFRQNSNK